MKKAAPAGSKVTEKKENKIQKVRLEDFILTSKKSAFDLYKPVSPYPDLGGRGCSNCPVD